MCGQTAVEQNVSPRATLDSVITSTSVAVVAHVDQRREHSLHHAAVDRTDHRMLDGDVAERTVVVDDAKLAVASVGVSGESLGREGVGDGLHRRTQ